MSLYNVNRALTAWLLQLKGRQSIMKKNAKIETKIIRKSLIEYGFNGFITIRELRNRRIEDIPKCAGVYVVLREIDTPPMFLDNNPGGRFKRKNPTVTKEELQSNWVDGAHVIYIGKGEQLQRRIKEYLDFGSGKPIGHWGGRLIWQIENSDDFVIAWKLIETGETARSLELKLFDEFVKLYGRLPYANLKR